MTYRSEDPMGALPRLQGVLESILLPLSLLPDVHVSRPWDELLEPDIPVLLLPPMEFQLEDS